MADAFFYVDGDRAKTPVDMKDMKPGTQMVFVDEKGRDHHFMAGTKVVNDPAKIKARFDRGNSGQAHES